MTTTSELPPRALLTPGEVAMLFHVDPKTVTRWAKSGKLPCIRTLGGHRRYRAELVLNLLRDGAEGVPWSSITEVIQSALQEIRDDQAELDKQRALDEAAIARATRGARAVPVRTVEEFLPEPASELTPQVV